MSSPKTATRKKRGPSPIRLPRGPRKGRGPGTTMVRQRIAAAAALSSSIRHYRHKVSAGLAARLLPGLRAQEAFPDFALGLDLMGRSVEAALEELLDAHRRYDRQTTLCHNLSLESDRLAKERLYPRAVGLRRAIDGAYGKEQALSIHGFKGEISTWREGLREQVRRSLGFLEHPKKSELPEPTVPGQKGDRGVWIRTIRPAFEALDERLGELARQNLERRLLGDERRRAMKAFDAALRRTRAVVEPLFILAGLAERQRRTLRADGERRRMIRWARERRDLRRLGSPAVEPVAKSGGAAKPGALGRLAAWLGARAHRT